MRASSDYIRSYVSKTIKMVTYYIHAELPACIMAITEFYESNR